MLLVAEVSTFMFGLEPHRALLALGAADYKQATIAIQLSSGLEKTGLRRERTVSIGFARRCAAARTVSIGLRGRYTFRYIRRPQASSGDQEQNSYNTFLAPAVTMFFLLKRLEPRKLLLVGIGSGGGRGGRAGERAGGRV